MSPKSVHGPGPKMTKYTYNLNNLRQKKLNKSANTRNFTLSLFERKTLVLVNAKSSWLKNVNTDLLVIVLLSPIAWQSFFPFIFCINHGEICVHLCVKLDDHLKNVHTCSDIIRAYISPILPKRSQNVKWDTPIKRITNQWMSSGFIWLIYLK